MRYFVRALVLGWFICLGGGCALGGNPTPQSGGITASFVVLGDNQLGKESIAPGDASSANVAQFRQTLKDIAALEPKPSYIFYTGDLVLNGADDRGETLGTRLEAWTKVYREWCREYGIEIPFVPVPGNKDVMKVIFKDGRPIEDLNPFTYPVWVNWLERSGFGRYGGNGPTADAPNPDRLAGDNRRLTYSFDDADGNHFIMINTFTLNNQPEPPRGWIPYHWIAEDARKAEANPRVRHIFAFGHMPIRIAGLPFDAMGDNSILNGASCPLAQQLQDTVGSLSKFRGYFCGHLHLWDCSLLPGTKEVWQVIGGMAGSKPIQRGAGAWQPPFFFGFNVVRTHPDGRVGVVSYRRPIPEPYYSSAPQPPAQPQPEIFLSRGGSKAPGEAGKQP